jgi:transposase
MNPTTIGVDLAKMVFELALADRHGHLIGRRRLGRRQFERFLAGQPACRLIMEACATAHHWARTARRYGHEVTLLPAQYVRAYVRRNKTDRADAEALLDAARSSGIRPVTVKTVAQQELLALHRLREQWMGTRTARINALRGILQEHGVTLPRGPRRALTALPALLEDAEAPLPGRLRAALALVLSEIGDLEDRVQTIERALAAVAAEDPVAQRLLGIPGVGLLTSTALLGSVGHIHGFPNGRRFASWLGLTPREHSTGGRRCLGTISKRGDAYLRRLLTHGARAVLLAAHRLEQRAAPLSGLAAWALRVDARRGHNKATIALANKLARVIWAVWSRDAQFVSRPALSKAS